MGRSRSKQPEVQMTAKSTSAWDLQNISDSLDEYPLLASLEKKTGIKKTVIALIILLTVISFVSWGVGMPILIMLFGTLVPLHTTMDAIRTQNMVAMKHMLCYWSLFSMFLASERFIDVFLSWVPLLNPLKLIVLFICYSPVYEGASLVYLNCIRPVIRKSLPNLKYGVSLFGRAVNYTRASFFGIILNSTRRFVLILREVSEHWVEQQDRLNSQQGNHL